MEELLTRIENSFPAGFEGLTKISRTGRDLSFSDVLKIRLEQESEKNDCSRTSGSGTNSDGTRIAGGKIE